MHILYLNVYLVTRHYGGSEEGGWWYDIGEPLASVPIPATQERGCDMCSSCRQASLGEKDTDGKPAEYCKEIPDDHDDVVADDVRRVSGRPIAYPQYLGLSEEEIGDMIHDEYMAGYPESTHLVPISHPVRVQSGTSVQYVDSLDVEKQKLLAMFADEQTERSRYSAAGGQDVVVRLEEHLAKPWPDRKPRYE